MNITEFIKDSEELQGLDFLSVYRTIIVLLRKGYLSVKDDVCKI